MIFFLRYNGYNESSGRPNFEVFTEFEKILNQNENLYILGLGFWHQQIYFRPVFLS